MFALIAGQGALPGMLAARLQADGTALLIAALAGSEPDPLTPDITFRIEQLGTFLDDLAKRGVTEVCFAGAITRPAIDPGRIDAKTKPLVSVIQAAIASGDDAALRAVLGLFEKAGFRIRAAHEVMPELLPPVGVLTAEQPDDQARRDAARGQAITDAIGAADVGQACVVTQGQALALEALPGTDWMLASVQQIKKRAPGGVLYKAPKPGQDRRADLPSVGEATIQNAAQSGLSGIVIEAGGVMVLDLAATIAAANDAGLFLWVRERGE